MGDWLGVISNIGNAVARLSETVESYIKLKRTYMNQSMFIFSMSAEELRKGKRKIPYEEWSAAKQKRLLKKIKSGEMIQTQEVVDKDFYEKMMVSVWDEEKEEYVEKNMNVRHIVAKFDIDSVFGLQLEAVTSARVSDLNKMRKLQKRIKHILNFIPSSNEELKALINELSNIFLDCVMIDRKRWEDELRETITSILRHVTASLELVKQIQGGGGMMGGAYGGGGYTDDEEESNYVIEPEGRVMDEEGEGEVDQVR